MQTLPEEKFSVKSLDFDPKSGLILFRHRAKGDFAMDFAANQLKRKEFRKLRYVNELLRAKDLSTQTQQTLDRSTPLSK